MQMPLVMKSVFSTAVFFICVTAFAQDATFINSLSATDREDARIISDKIAELTTLNYRFYKAIETEKDSTYTVIYAPKEVSDADLESKNDWNDCLFVDFKNNKQAKLSFKSIRGKYIDIFPAWKKFFKQKAHMEYTITDPSTREVANNGYKFVLVEGNNARIPRWSIENKS